MLDRILLALAILAFTLAIALAVANAGPPIPEDSRPLGYGTYKLKSDKDPDALPQFIEVGPIYEHDDQWDGFVSPNSGWTVMYIEDNPDDDTPGYYQSDPHFTPPCHREVWNFTPARDTPGCSTGTYETWVEVRDPVTNEWVILSHDFGTYHKQI